MSSRHFLASLALVPALTVPMAAHAAPTARFDLQAHRGGRSAGTRFPEQEQIKGFRMVELRDVFSLVRSYRARGVKLTIETKVEAGAPEQTAPRELFVRRVFEEIRRSGIERQVTRR